jgi:putative redox protein
MGVDIDVIYSGQLHCTATHGPSGVQILTDAPKDNGGKGECFSPTDLVAAATGTCMATIMALAVQRLGLPVDLAGTQIHVVKEMAPGPNRRIADLKIRISIPADASPSDRAKIEKAAMACPVKNSLHPDVKLSIQFDWGKHQ